MRDKMIGTICVCVGIMTILGTRGLAIMSKGMGFGPGAFPFAVGSGLILLGVLLILKSFFVKEEQHLRLRFLLNYTPFIILIVTSTYLGFILLFGFLLSTILFVFFMTRIFGEKSIWISTLYGISLGLIVHVVFAICLKLPLPKGHLIGLIGMG